MDRKDRYQRIEFINPKDEKPCDTSKMIGSNIIVHEEDFQDDEIFPASPVSSTPPNDFDTNFETQYIPLYNDSTSPNQDERLRSTSSASSLSGDCINEYNTSPVLLTSSTTAVKCPVCEELMRTYYCAKCIQRGRFVTIDTTQADRFIERDINLQNVMSTLPNQQSEEIDNMVVLEEMLQIKYRTLARKTEALKNLCNKQQLKLKHTKNLLKITKDQLDLEKKSNKSKEGKIELMKRYIASRRASIKKRRDSESTLVDEMKEHINRRVYQLTNDIFPIEEINLLEQNTSLVNMETSPLLTFSDGSHHHTEQQAAFSIVEPWLPSDGDYSSYSLWLSENQDHIPASMSDLSERNPAFRIGAALAYTSQLVKNIASYLDVILPAKLELSTFNRELMNDTQFSYNVAKLNTNIIYLCVSQGVDVSLLQPNKTLKNLMLLFNLNISDIGRKPVFELDNEEALERIEESLSQDLSLLQDSFYDFSKFVDDDDISDSEWEISDSVNPMEMVMAEEQSIQQNSYIRLPLRLFASFWSTGS